MMAELPLELFMILERNAALIGALFVRARDVGGAQIYIHSKTDTHSLS